MTFIEFLNESEAIAEVFARGNHNTKDKMLKKRINRLKRLKRCSGNMTAKVSTKNGQVKVVCSPKDRKRARLQKKLMRKRKANKAMFRKSLAKAQDTKKFRKR